MRYAPRFSQIREPGRRFQCQNGCSKSGGEFVVREEVAIMSKRAVLQFVAITATAMLSVIGVASAGPGGGGGGGHGGGGGGHFGGGGFHGGGRGSYGGWHGGYRWRGGYYGRYGGWCCGWGWGLGWYLPVLPWYYDTYWWNGMPYYYADGDYYLWDSGAGQYEAVDPPAGLTPVRPSGLSTATTPLVSTALFAYPKAGQSEAQQKQDKDDCRRWATKQTGFDPTQPTDQNGKSDGTSQQGYLRAEAACLEARNYSVR
jgi:hypothetical protein